MTDALFRSKAPGIMNLLMADFGLDVESAAAILGNLGHESGGFKFLQEKQPLIPGSAGGYGWAQWTGPRRRAYEAYCQRNGFDPASDTANYKYLFVELSGDERAAIPAVKNAVGLEAKVQAFEMAFERAGIKHYDGRNKWARTALDAYQANPGGTIDVRDAAGAPAKEGEILSPAVPGTMPPLDLGRILGVLLPLLQHVVTDPKLRDTVLPLVFQILGVKPADAKPVEPAKPATSVNPVTKGSLLTAIAVALAGGAAQLNGSIPPPVGETSSLLGIVTSLAPLGIAAFGGPIGGIASKLFSGFASWAANRKPS
jgi:hypothetical protein